MPVAITDMRCEMIPQRVKEDILRHQSTAFIFIVYCLFCHLKEGAILDNNLTTSFMISLLYAIQCVDLQQLSVNSKTRI